MIDRHTIATVRRSVGPARQVGPEMLDQVPELEEHLSDEEMDRVEQALEDLEGESKISLVRKLRELEGEALDELPYDSVASYWKASALAGFQAGMTHDFGHFRDTVFGPQAGILQNFKGIGALITSIAISLGVGAIVLSEFNNQTNDSTASNVLDQGLTLLTDTIDWMGVAVIMLFGVIFMRYME